MNTNTRQLAQNISSLNNNAEYVVKKSGTNGIRNITGKLIRRSIKTHIQQEFAGDFNKLPSVRDAKTRRGRAILLERAIHQAYERQIRQVTRIAGELDETRPIRWERVEASLVTMLANQLCPMTVDLNHQLNGVLSSRIHTLREKLGCPPFS